MLSLASRIAIPPVARWQACRTLGDARVALESKSHATLVLQGTSTKSVRAMRRQEGVALGAAAVAVFQCVADPLPLLRRRGRTIERCLAAQRPRGFGTTREYYSAILIGLTRQIGWLFQELVRRGNLIGTITATSR